MTWQTGWLDDFASNTYSQFGEDGVLQTIFRVIGAANKWCLECGAADGLFFSNTRRFLEDGWCGILVEADPEEYKRLCSNSDEFGERVSRFLGRVDNDNRLETILRRCNAPVDIDLVVIDVDGQDYYLFNSLLQYRPRVVVVEYNNTTTNPDFIPKLNGEGQAGENAILKLGCGKLYAPVWKSLTNIVFVHQPLHRLLSRENALQEAA